MTATRPDTMSFRQFDTVPDLLDLRLLKQALPSVMEATLRHENTKVSLTDISSIQTQCLQLTQANQDYHVQVEACAVLVIWLKRLSYHCKGCIELRTTFSQDIVTFETMALLLIEARSVSGSLQTIHRELFTQSLVTAREVLTETHYHGLLESLCKRLLQASPLLKTTYLALELFQSHAGNHLITLHEPAFFETRLTYLSDRALATPLSRILLRLVTGIQPTSKKQEPSLPVWQHPLLLGLSNKHDALNQSVLVYMLPTLLRISRAESLTFLRMVVEHFGSKLLSLTTVLSCLTIAKEVQAIDGVDAKILQTIELPPQLVKLGPFDTDPHLRSVSLDLLVATGKTTQLFSQLELDSLKQCLPSFFGETSADLRKLILKVLDKLLNRLKASIYYSANQIARSRSCDTSFEEHEHYITAAASFLQWFTSLVCEYLEPGSGYQRKFIALQILTQSRKYCWSAQELSCINHPELTKSLCSDQIWTEAYFLRLIMDCLSDPFDGCRRLAMDILCGLEHTGRSFLGTLLNNRKDKAPLRARAHELEGIMQIGLLRHTLEMRHQSSIAVYLPEVHSKIASLQKALRESMSMSSCNKGSVENELNVLHLFLGLMLREFPNQLKADQAIRIIDEIISLVQLSWAATCEALSDDSPEGHLPSADAFENELIRSEMAQQALAHAWRTMRSASPYLLIATRLAFDFEESRLSTIGDHYKTWLSLTRHRGAFSAIASDFSIFMNMMLKFSKTSQWSTACLESMIDSLSDEKHFKDVTRRSGGLPVTIVTILVAESEVLRTAHFMRLAVHRLMDMARVQVSSETNVSEPPQVHAMNTLREIFLESRLSKNNIMYLEETLAVTLGAFSSPSWAIRNCALMVFSSISKRIFGSKARRLDTSNQTLTIDMCIHLYPTLSAALASALSESVFDLTSSTAYDAELRLEAILTFFSQLGVLNETQRFRHEIQSLLQNVQHCATLEPWHIRILASQVFPALLPLEEVSGAVQKMLLRSAATTNEMHSSFLQILAILTAYKKIERADVAQMLQNLGVLLIPYLQRWAYSELHPELRSLLLRICMELPKGSSKIEFSLAQFLIEKSLQDVKLISVSPGSMILVTASIEFLVFAIERFPSAIDFKDIERLLPMVDEPTALMLYDSCSNTGAIQKLASQSREFCTHLASRCVEDRTIYMRIRATKCFIFLYFPLKDEWVEAQIDRIKISTAIKPGHLGNNEICLLAACIKNPEDERHERISIALKLFTQAENELNSREAALKSLIFLRTMPSVFRLDADQISEELIKIAIQFYQFLIDDDEDLRIRAAKFACQKLLLIDDLHVSFVKHRYLQRLVHSHPQSKVLQRSLLERITGQGSASAQFEATFARSGDVFIVEKQNLWIIESEEAYIAAEALAAVKLHQSLVEDLSQWSIDAIETIGKHLENNQDGPLGWSSDPEVWQFIKRACIAARFARPRISQGQSRALHDKIADILALSERQKLHPVIIDTLKQIA